MGKVQAFDLSGHDCWFYSGDHLPPHFHVQRPGEWEIRVFFLRDPIAIEVKFSTKRIPRSALKSIRALVQEHRAELFREWEANSADE